MESSVDPDKGSARVRGEAPRSSHHEVGGAGSDSIGLDRPRCTCERPAWRFAGRAERESHERCERPEWLVCVGCDARVLKRCGRSSRAVCGPCSETYRRRVARVAHSGFEVVGRQVVHVLTLTAPGERAHRLPSGELCRCTPVGGVDLATWNGALGRRWSRFVDALRYHFGDVQFFAAKEVQRRGALHLHVPIVFERHQAVRVDSIRQLAIDHGFGHEVALDRVEPGSRQAQRAGWYVAKYVTKAATDRDSVPFVHPITGEVGHGRWRTWTCSRRWGLSMASVRAAQRAWVQEGGGGPGPVAPEVLPVGPQAPLDPNTLSSGIVAIEPPFSSSSMPM